MFVRSREDLCQYLAVILDFGQIVHGKIVIRDKQCLNKNLKWLFEQGFHNH